MAKKVRRASTGSAWAPQAVPSLDLHALTVVEALPEVDVFLHDCFRAGYHRVRVVHGKGTGVLKAEVTRYLSTHPLVIGYRASDVYHGGTGATEVDLSDK